MSRIITAQSEAQLMYQWLNDAQFDDDVNHYICMTMLLHLHQPMAFDDIITMRYVKIANKKDKLALQSLGDLCCIDTAIMHNKEHYLYHTYQRIGKACYQQLYQLHQKEGSNLYILYRKLFLQFEAIAIHLHTKLDDQNQDIFKR